MKFTKSTGGRRRVKRNPSRRKASHKRRRVRHNPAPSHVAHRRRAGRRRVRRNPSGLDLKAFGMEVAAIGGGMLAGVYVNNLAAKWLPARFRGLGSIVAGAALAMFGGRSEILERAALGAAGMGLLDIVRNNVPALVPLSAEDAGYLLGNAAQHDESVAAMLGTLDTGVPGVLPNIFGVDTAGVPMGADEIPQGIIPNVFGVDTAGVPMGDDGEGDGMFSDYEDGDGL